MLSACVWHCPQGIFTFEIKSGDLQKNLKSSYSRDMRLVLEENSDLGHHQEHKVGETHH